MKYAFLIISTLIISASTFADLGEDHAKNCELTSVKKLMGNKGSCRVVIAPKKIKKSGSCTGTFQKTMSCTISFDSESKDVGMNLKCGDAEDPVINQDMEAEFIGYNVTTLVKNSEGKDIIVQDKTNYSLISNRMITISLNESDENSSSKVLIDLDAGSVELEDLSCK